MGQQVARIQPLELIPFIYPEFAQRLAFDPAPNLTVARGTVLGQVTSAVNDVDTITLNNTPTGGTFAITVVNNNGTYTTPALAYNAASTTTVQAAVQALANIGAGNALVTGSAGGPYTVTGAGALAATGLGVVTADGTLLTGAGAQPTATVVHGTSYAVAGEVKPYATGNSDGSQNPVCVSIFDFSTDIDGNITLGNGVPWGLSMGHTQTIPGYVSGWFREGDLVGLDSGAVTAFKAREFTLSDGTKAVRIP